MRQVTLTRFGDFYEALGDDAAPVAEAAGLPLVDRTHPDTKEEVAMCGFPVVRAPEFLPLLLDAGLAILFQKRPQDQSPVPRPGRTWTEYGGWDPPEE